MLYISSMNNKITLLSGEEVASRNYLNPDAVDDFEYYMRRGDKFYFRNMFYKAIIKVNNPPADLT